MILDDEYENENEEPPEIEGLTETIEVKLTGTTQLLMNSNAGVNPLNDLVKQKAILTSKPPKQRTEEDVMEIYRLDFMLGLYYDEELGPYVPGANLEKAIHNAATMEKLGKKIDAGVKVAEDKVPLEYKGPRDPDKLWKAKFADIRPTKLKGTSSLMKCRPSFRNWKLSFHVNYDGAIIDRQQVERCVRKIGNVGICDYRKRFGKSNVEIV